MFTKALATALVSGLLLSGAMTTQSFAHDGGGDGAGFDEWARMQKQNGSTVTSRANRDGSHSIFHRDRHGKITKKERRAARKVAGRKAKKVLRHSRPWASSFDRTTGRRVTSIGNGDHTRTVITISPFGFSIGISR